MGGRSIPRITMARVDSTSLYFANTDWVITNLRDMCRFNYTHYMSPKNISSNSNSSSTEASKNKYTRTEVSIPHKDLKVLIVDFSSVVSIDVTAVNLLKEFKKELFKDNILIAYVQGSSLNDELVQITPPLTPGRFDETDYDNGDGGEESAYPVGLRRRNEYGLDEYVYSSRESIAYAQAILSSGPVTRNHTRFSPGPMMATQLRNAGANRQSTEADPILSHFSTLTEAVKYFTIHMYMDMCIPVPGPDTTTTTANAATAVTSSEGKAEKLAADGFFSGVSPLHGGQDQSGEENEASL